MTMGSSNCPRCGIALDPSWKTFCGNCGASLAAVLSAPPTPPAPPAPVQAPQPPAPVAPAAPQWTAPAPPVQPQAYPSYQPAAPQAQPQAQVPPSGQWGATAPAAGQEAWSGYGPAPKAKGGVNPILLVVIGLVVVALVVGVGLLGVFAISGGGSGGGSLSVNPSTIKCSSGASVTMTVRLPSSINGDARVATQLDSKSWGSVVVSSSFQKQSDGTWLHSATSSLDTCQGPSGQLSPGSHTLTIVDANGKTLAEGSFTVAP
jgi:hypothetical protein